MSRGVGGAGPFISGGVGWAGRGPCALAGLIEVGALDSAFHKLHKSVLCDVLCGILCGVL